MPDVLQIMWKNILPKILNSIFSFSLRNRNFSCLFFMKNGLKHFNKSRSLFLVYNKEVGFLSCNEFYCSICLDIGQNLNGYGMSWEFEIGQNLVQLDNFNWTKCGSTGQFQLDKMWFNAQKMKFSMKYFFNKCE